MVGGFMNGRKGARRHENGVGRMPILFLECGKKGVVTGGDPEFTNGEVDVPRKNLAA